MMKIADYANNCKVKVLVTSSFRYNSDVKDPIVTPAKKSNHMAGHSIDMNLLYGENYKEECDSKCLKDLENVPESV